MSRYDAEQKQRAMERQIRKERSKLAALDTAIKSTDDEELKTSLKNDFDSLSVKLKSHEAKYKDFSYKTGLPPQKQRLQMYGFGRSVSQKAVHSNKSVISSRKAFTNPKDSDIINAELFSKNNSARKGFTFISDRRFEELTIEARKKGAIILRGTEEVEKHLDEMDAAASIIGDTLLFRKDVCVSEVLEETHHYIQNLTKLNDDKPIELRTILNEIDAKRFVIENAQKYGVPRIEIEHCQKQLSSYEKQLQAFYKNGGE